LWGVEGGFEALPPRSIGCGHSAHEGEGSEEMHGVEIEAKKNRRLGGLARRVTVARFTAFLRIAQRFASLQTILLLPRAESISEELRGPA
jgi:hypothetical protein